MTSRRTDLETRVDEEELAAIVQCRNTVRLQIDERRSRCHDHPNADDRAGMAGVRKATRAVLRARRRSAVPVRSTREASHRSATAVNDTTRHQRRDHLHLKAARRRGPPLLQRVVVERHPEATLRHRRAVRTDPVRAVVELAAKPLDRRQPDARATTRPRRRPHAPTPRTTPRHPELQPLPCLPRPHSVAPRRRSTLERSRFLPSPCARTTKFGAEGRSACRILS